VNPQLLEEIVALIVQLGPLAIDLIVKLEGLLNLGPDEKKNIANAIAASNAADQQTVARVTAWMAANGFAVSFGVPAPSTPKA
jgi:L-cysteine desulfidase